MLAARVKKKKTTWLHNNVNVLNAIDCTVKDG